jgi:putative sulfotransferase
VESYEELTVKEPWMTAIERSVILNTGRCGSTMLSKLIAQEPSTASISESMAFGTAGAADVTITGEEFWAKLREPSPQIRTQVRLDLLTGEFRYPASGLWAGNLAELPAILAVTLPSVSADPDHLFDRLAAVVPDFPAQPVSAHRVDYLDLLATLTGRRRWVERSGGSCTLPGPILDAVPDGKVVYLTRNVADTARSMSRHPAFQFAALRLEFSARCGLDPYDPAHAGDPTVPARVPPDLRGLLPDNLTTDVFWARGRSARWFEGLCTTMHDRTEKALAHWDPKRLLRLRYEDLVSDPVGELLRLGEFLGFADPAGWSTQVAPRVRRA